MNDAEKPVGEAAAAVCAVSAGLCCPPKTKQAATNPSSATAFRKLVNFCVSPPARNPSQFKIVITINIETLKNILPPAKFGAKSLEAYSPKTTEIKASPKVL